MKKLLTFIFTFSFFYAIFINDTINKNKKPIIVKDSSTGQFGILTHTRRPQNMDSLAKIKKSKN